MLRRQYLNSYTTNHCTRPATVRSSLAPFRRRVSLIVSLVHQTSLSPQAEQPPELAHLSREVEIDCSDMLSFQEKNALPIPNLLKSWPPLIPVKIRAGAKARFKKPTEVKLAFEAALFGDFNNGQGRGEQQTLATP